MSSSHDTIAIFGLGLIGSSIARAVRTRLRYSRLVGYDVDPVIREQVASLGLVDAIAATPEEAVSDAGIVIFCVPVGAIAEMAAGVAPHVRADAVVSDVGSSKSSVASAVQAACPGVAFVPAHPIAGSHATGPAAGTADLFEGRWCVLTPSTDCPPHAVEKIASLWRSLGARVEFMTAEGHDLVLAATSHVPHLLAFASVLSVTKMESESGADIMTYSASGFRDFTRIAAADPVVWRDTLLSNRDAIRTVLAGFRECLGQLERMVETDQSAALTGILAAIREKRLELDVPPAKEG